MANLRTDYEDGELFLPDFLNETNARVNNFKTTVDSVYNLVHEAAISGGTVQSAVLVECSAQGLASENVNAALAELATEIFPLTVEVGTYTDTYEVGSTNIKPEIPVAIKRHGEYVDGAATIVVSPNTAEFDTTNHKVVETGTLYTQMTGTQPYQVTATQGGQTKSVTARVYVQYYAYYGDIGTSTLADATAVKNKIESSWRDTNKKFSTKTDSTLITSDGKVTNQANHYYLFAVQGSRTLIVKNAATGGVISGCQTGTATIQRVNGSGSDTYSWVIVPASPNSWDFKITNS